MTGIDDEFIENFGKALEGSKGEVRKLLLDKVNKAYLDEMSLRRIVENLKKVGEKEVARELIKNTLNYLSGKKEYEYAGRIALEYGFKKESEKFYNSWVERQIDLDRYDKNTRIFLERNNLLRDSTKKIIRRKMIQAEKEGKLEKAFNLAKELKQKRSINRIARKCSQQFEQENDIEEAAKYADEGGNPKRAMALYESIHRYREAGWIAERLGLENKVAAYKLLDR